MSENNVEFLIGADLSAKVRHVCAGQNVRCAVAFWGKGAAASLFPQGLENAILICDISMGGTSKAALVEMGGPTNPKLLVRDGLHAKIYVSDRGAVVGSANASDNGLGLTPGGSGRLWEAGLFCPVGVPAYHAAGEAVDQLIGAAASVNADDIARAPERSHELQPELSAADLRRLPLLAALQQAPRAFSNLTVIVVTENTLNTERAKTVKSQYLRSRKGLVVDNDIGVEFIEDHDGVIETLQRNVLMFNLPDGSKAPWYARLYTRVELLPRKHPKFGFGFSGSNHASGILRPLIRGKKLSDTEQDTLHRVSEQNSSTWAYTPKAFSDALARAKVV